MNKQTSPKGVFIAFAMFAMAVSFDSFAMTPPSLQLAAVETTAEAAPASRESVATNKLLIELGSRMNQVQMNYDQIVARLGAQVDRGSSIALLLGVFGLLLTCAAVVVGIFVARYMESLKTKRLIAQGRQPLSVLIHSTRDEVTRLAQRLKMAGATDTALYGALLEALPALQVEAGKATINLGRLIPESARASLEGPVVPLEPMSNAVSHSRQILPGVSSGANVHPINPRTSPEPAARVLRASDVGVEALCRNLGR